MVVYSFGMTLLYYIRQGIIWFSETKNAIFMRSVAFRKRLKISRVERIKRMINIPESLITRILQKNVFYFLVLGQPKNLEVL